MPAPVTSQRSELLRGLFVRGNKMERAMGLEPTTPSLGSWYSTIELRPLSTSRLFEGIF